MSYQGANIDLSAENAKKKHLYSLSTALDREEGKALIICLSLQLTCVLLIAQHQQRFMGF